MNIKIHLTHEQVQQIIVEKIKSTIICNVKAKDIIITALSNIEEKSEHITSRIIVDVEFKTRDRYE